MLRTFKPMLIAGAIAAGAVTAGAVTLAAGAQAGVGGVAGVAKKTVASESGATTAQTVHYRRICHPVFRHRWTPWGWRRVFVGRRCFFRPHRHFRGPRWGWGRPHWRRHHWHARRWHARRLHARRLHAHRWHGRRWGGWRRGGPRIVLRFGR